MSNDMWANMIIKQILGFCTTAYYKENLIKWLKKNLLKRSEMSQLMTHGYFEWSYLV